VVAQILPKQIPFFGSAPYSVWLVVINKIATQQNRNKSLHGIGNPLEQRTEMLEHHYFFSFRLMHWPRLCALCDFRWCLFPTSPTYSFQAGWVRVPVTCRPSTAVPRRRLPSSIAHWPSSSLCWHKNLCRSPNKHSVRGHKFLKLRSKIGNSLPSALRQPGLRFAMFKQHLKSHLFNAIWGRGA